jgi:hypothetical protein
MQIAYHLIVLYLVCHLIWYLIRERKFWNQVCAALVLIMFLLRLFLIK